MSLAYALIALSFPLQILFLYEHPMSEIPQALSKLTFFNWIVIGALGCGSVLFYRGSTKMVPAAIAVTVLVLANNILVGVFGEDFQLWQTLGASVLFGSLHLSLRNEEVRKLIQQPELRWWRTAYRQKLRIPVILRTKNYHHLNFESFDISDTGIFISATPGLVASLKGLKLGEIAVLTMKFDTLTQIRCNARIARISEGGGQYPSGIGIEFVDLSAKDRKRIHRFRAKKMEQEAIAPAMDL